MESIHANAKARLRCRQWQNAIATDGADTAEAIVLGYVLGGWLTDLDYRLGFEKPYTSDQDRYVQMQQTIAYVNWLIDRMAELMGEGQNMVAGSDRILFELLRDAGYDLSFRALGIEGSAPESSTGGRP